ncbi:uncharacterized protein LOC119081310 [Bradysia coprophila]|uniref:uncharacterized protein LOC119081310 n=1 Tax=Bradysia coprophila TaxID=38358 RepID=UPI00187D9B31|nr:uncharacterized protein LOC119081310 [Bradysia coprophila]
MFKPFKIIGMGQSTLNHFKRLERRCSPLFRCNITTNQQNQSKENEKYLPKKRKISFSNVHMKVASEILGVEIDYLLQKQQLGPENVIQLIEPPNELYKDVYERLKVILRTHSYPHGLSSESNKTTYVDTLLFTIVDHVNRDLETHPKILLVKEYDIKMVYDGDVLLGRLDYAIVQLSSRKEQACLLIVECKKENVDVAVKQCLLALKHIYSGRPVYGCCTTAEDWNFIMFNGDDFKIIHKRNVIFPHMDEHEDLWMKNCTLVIQIIYSCLIEQLRQFKN